MKKIFRFFFGYKEDGYPPNILNILLVIAIAAFIGVSASAFYFLHEGKQEEQNERAELAKRCDVIGDALDYGPNGKEMRTLFFCPDGKMRIR